MGPKCPNLLWNVSERSMPRHEDQDTEETGGTVLSELARLCPVRHGGKLREEHLGSLWEEVVPQEGWTGLRIDR